MDDVLTWWMSGPTGDLLVSGWGPLVVGCGCAAALAATARLAHTDGHLTAAARTRLVATAHHTVAACHHLLAAARPVAVGLVLLTVTHLPPAGTGVTR